MNRPHSRMNAVERHIADGPKNMTMGALERWLTECRQADQRGEVLDLPAGWDWDSMGQFLDATISSHSN